MKEKLRVALFVFMYYLRHVLWGLHHRLAYGFAEVCEYCRVRSGIPNIASQAHDDQKLTCGHNLLVETLYCWYNWMSSR